MCFKNPWIGGFSLVAGGSGAGPSAAGRSERHRAAFALLHCKSCLGAVANTEHDDTVLLKFWCGKGSKLNLSSQTRCDMQVPCLFLKRFNTWLVYDLLQCASSRSVRVWMDRSTRRPKCLLVFCPTVFSVALSKCVFPAEALCSWHREDECVFWKKGITAEYASADEVLSETSQLGLAILSVLEPNMLHSVL